MHQIGQKSNPHVDLWPPQLQLSIDMQVGGTQHRVSFGYLCSHSVCPFQMQTSGEVDRECGTRVVVGLGTGAAFQ
jgi:hypothetical protein